MKCTDFIDRTEWSCQITKSRKNCNSKLPCSEYLPYSNKSDKYLIQSVLKNTVISIWSTNNSNEQMPPLINVSVNVSILFCDL